MLAKVLVVGFTDAQESLIHSTLQSLGHSGEVCRVPNITQLTAVKPDIPKIIVAAFAPEGDMRWQKLLEVKKQLFSQSRFIFLSSPIGENLALQCGKAGADAFFNFNQLNELKEYILSNLEDELSPDEEMVDALVNCHAGEGYCIVGFDYIIKQSNLCLKHLLGKGGELTGYDFLKFVYPSDVATLKAAFDTSFANQSQASLVAIRLVSGNDMVILCNLSLVPIVLSPDNKAVKVHIVHRAMQTANIRKQLVEQEEMYRGLITAIPDILVRTDINGNIIFVNNADLSAYGFGDASEILGMNLFDFLSPDEIERATENSFRMFQEYLGPQQYKAIVKNKQEVVLEINGDALRHPDGTAFGMVYIIRDITTQVAIDNSIKASEVKLRTLINAMPDIVCFKDGKGRWLEANDFDLKLFQLEGIDYFGKKDSELAEYSGFYKEAFLTCEDSDEKTWLNGVTTRAEEVIPKPDGTNRVFDIIKVPTFSLTGEREGLVVIGRDITEIKKAQKALEESKLEFQNYFEQGTVGLSVTDIHKRYVEVNRKTCDMLGYSRQELLNMTWEQVTYPDDIQANVDNFNRVLSGEIDTYQMNKRFIHKDGQLLYITLFVVCQRKPDGSVRQFLSSMIDITEAHKAQEALKLSEENYRRIVETAQEGICMMDAKENPVFINNKMAQLLGYSAEEMMQHPYSYYLFEDDLSEHTLQMQNRTAGKNAFYERRFRKKDGGTLWCLVSATALLDSNGIYKGSFGMFVDITESKLQREELEIAKDMAEKSSALKDAFIANISHEIRTPLNGILGFTDVVQERFAKKATPEELFYFRQISKSGKRLMRTVELIMNYSRLKLGDFPINKKWVDVRQLIGKLLADFELLNEKKAVKLVFTDRCENHLLFTDEYALTSILTELIDNALKFTQSGFVKVVLCAKDPCDFCIEIKDTGIGMSEDYLKCIFEPFMQEEVGFNRNYEGIGLGLSIVKKLMDGLEASIEVKSSKGLGTVFTLGLGKTSKLGLVDVAPQPNDNKDITAKTSKPKILIVEDDETSQLYIEMVLKNSYDTFVAASSSEAIEMLYQQAVDLVLMDISLRGSMNGLELTRWIRSSAKHSEIPIIAVTAHAFEADRGMALEAGCNQFIAKPFKSAELLRAIQQVLF